MDRLERAEDGTPFFDVGISFSGLIKGNDAFLKFFVCTMYRKILYISPYTQFI